MESVSRSSKIQGIYRIVEIKTGRFYIGSTVDYMARKRLHLWSLRHDRHHSPKLQRAWNKHGAEAFEIQFLEAIAHLDAMIAREQELLDTLKPYFNVAIDAVKPNRGRGQSAVFREAMRARGLRLRREVCVRGHPLSGDNLYISPHGRRGCRACTNANSHRHRMLAAEREGRSLQAHTRDRTHCPSGHPYEGDNLYFSVAAGRQCRICKRQHEEERRRRKRAEKQEQS